MDRQSHFAPAGDLLAHSIQLHPHRPRLQPDHRRQDCHHFRFKVVKPTPTSHVVGQGHEEVFQVIDLTPSSMRECEPCQGRRDALLFEQAGAIVFVLTSWAGEFIWVQRLAEIVGRRPEQNGVPIYIDAGELSGEAIEKLDGGGVDERKVSDQQRRSHKNFAEACGVRR